MRVLAEPQRAGTRMSASVIQVVLLWAAVFIGLDLSFGEGALTDGFDEALQRAVKWVRQLLWPNQ